MISLLPVDLPSQSPGPPRPQPGRPTKPAHALDGDVNRKGVACQPEVAAQAARKRAKGIEVALGALTTGRDF